MSWDEVNIRVPQAVKLEWQKAAGPRNLSAWIRSACDEKLKEAVHVQARPTITVKLPGRCERHGLEHCYSCKTGRYA